MFFLLISEIIPSTSLALPLLGKYLLFTMVLVGFSVLITIGILNVHYRKPSTHKMAPWVRSFFIRTLPKLLMMRVPEDLLKQLASNKINYGVKLNSKKGSKKTKFNDALTAHQFQDNSGGSSPDSIRHMQGRTGCNGLHTTTASNRCVVSIKWIAIFIFGKVELGSWESIRQTLQFFTVLLTILSL